jgi:hypothetical protein
MSDFSQFSFNPDEKWEVSTDTLLPKGNHVCTVDSLKEDTSSGNYPQVVVKTSNAEGGITDWITISSPQTFGKFTAFVIALGVPEADYPQDGDYDASNGRVHQAYLDKLSAKYGSNRIGVVVREEQDNRDPMKTRLQVKGYVPAAELGSDATPAGSSEQFANSNAGVGVAADDSIPF